MLPKSFGFIGVSNGCRNAGLFTLWRPCQVCNSCPHARLQVTQIYITAVKQRGWSQHFCRSQGRCFVCEISGLLHVESVSYKYYHTNTITQHDTTPLTRKVHTSANCNRMRTQLSDTITYHASVANRRKHKERNWTQQVALWNNCYSTILAWSMGTAKRESQRAAVVWRSFNQTASQ